MGGEPIDHIAFLVPNLEEAIERWSNALGYTFSPVARYRTERYSDRHNPELHSHDVRLTLSREGHPRIELMEIHGEGTHGPSEIGVHHLGIRVPDVARRMAEVARQGIGDDGVCTRDDGSVSIWFTEKSALDGIRLEFISPLSGPLVADDGGPLWIDPETGAKSLWGPPKDV